ncbi:MAG: hypothetical protein FJZ38_25275 [Candidatus Rokubacteria bacterium]|nr:hypothetical protein [Candidatus Rokubacteria bacterium]
MIVGAADGLGTTAPPFVYCHFSGIVCPTLNATSAGRPYGRWNPRNPNAGGVGPGVIVNDCVTGAAGL